MKRLVSMLSCALLASLVASGCSKKDGAKVDPADTKPAETDKAAPSAAPAADPALAAAPAAGEPGAVPPAGGAMPAAAVTPTEPSAEEKALAEKAVAMLEEMATAAEKNSADCAKAATTLQAIVDKNKALIEAGKKMDDNPGTKAWFEQTYQGRMMGSMQKMVPLMEKCKDNPELLKVFTSMQ
jgi:hypothetical protein